MPDTQPNVILVTIDALRADHLSCYGYGRETSPVLDKIAEESVRYRKAYSASSHTREAVPALLTGRYPDECVDPTYKLVGPSIASHLSEFGYTTGAFHSNPYVSRAYGFNRGFDVFDDDLHFSRLKLLALAQRALDKLRNRHYATAETITKRALSYVESADAPFFLWAHYMDTHGPYCPPEEYQTMYHDEIVSEQRASQMYKRAAVTDPEGITDAERREMVNLYDGEIRYAQDHIGTLIHELDNRGHLDYSLVIITSDHGDAFGENGYYGHPRLLDTELLHVPLLLKSRNVSPQTVDTPTSTLDIVPTILDTVGIDGTIREDFFAGTSLLKIIENHISSRTIYSQARSEDNALRRFSGRSPDGAWFVSRSMASESNETEFLEEWGDGPDELARLVRRHSEERTARSASGRNGWSEDDPPVEIERRLEALGYKE